MQDYTRLLVWQKSHELAMDIVRETRHFRARELSVVRRQLERAAQSIPSNIVEGSGAISNLEFARFLEIALKSAAETHYHLLSSRDLGAGNDERLAEFAERVDEVRRMLYGLIRRVRES